MAYSDFTFDKIETELQLSISETNLYGDIAPISISPLLQEILQENVPLSLSINTEKARSEMIISPILIELRKMLEHRISLFSGTEFNIEPQRGLNGVCDFIISGSSTQILLTAPVIQIVEAKNENIKNGIPQYIAEMYAAQLFNQNKQQNLPDIYGVVTTGSSWKFMQLREQQVTIDCIEYFIDNAGKILGVLQFMVNQVLVFSTSK